MQKIKIKNSNGKRSTGVISFAVQIKEIELRDLPLCFLVDFHSMYALMNMIPNLIGCLILQKNICLYIYVCPIIYGLQVQVLILQSFEPKWSSI